MRILNPRQKLICIIVLTNIILKNKMIEKIGFRVIENTSTNSTNSNGWNKSIFLQTWILIHYIKHIMLTMLLHNNHLKCTFIQVMILIIQLMLDHTRTLHGYTNTWVGSMQNDSYSSMKIIQISFIWGLNYMQYNSFEVVLFQDVNYGGKAIGYFMPLGLSEKQFSP